MSHAHDCDLEVYGRLPNAQGVVCTCDQDDGDEPAELPAPPAQNRVVLTGDAAKAYKALATAVTQLRRAQEQHAAALAKFTEAVS